jgi:TolB-like protein/DNA-binding winged helix-turn-helix (wHTH) protein/Flp pilus assembly protein TadD
VFGDFEVDLGRGSLKRRGEEIALRPKSYAVLLYLLEHAGRLVSRDELLAAVWPGAVVSDQSVGQCLIDLRKALGDSSHSLIRTVPRRGLLLDVPVRFEDSTGPSILRGWALQRGWLLIALLVVTIAVAWWWAEGRRPAKPPAATEPVSLVVLRFADMSDPTGHSSLADGFSEEIMHGLAQSPYLNVIARTSAFAIDGEAIDVIANRLGVSYALEGSVRTEENRIRVTAQLIDVQASTHLWSKSFDRDLDDLIEVQKEISGSVAQALKTTLGDPPASADVDPRAYPLFLEAQFFYGRRAAGDKERAEERLRAALAIDPEFARAWALLAAVAAARLGDPSPGIEDRELRAQLRENQRHAVQQALAYGPGLPDAHHRAAQYFFYNGEPDKALEHLETARSIDPNHWLVLVALTNDQRHAGRIDSAIRLMRRNVRRDPLNASLRADLVSTLLWAGRLEEVGPEFERIRDVNPAVLDEAPFLGRHVVHAYVLQQDFDAALALVESLPEGADRTQSLALVLHGQRREGDAASALRLLAAQTSTAAEMVSVAEVHAYRDEPATALAWLERIEFGTDCSEGHVLWSAYYSPFLALLGDDRAWMEVRSSVFEIMQGCRLGLHLDADST